MNCFPCPRGPAPHEKIIASIWDCISGQTAFSKQAGLDLKAAV